MKKKVIMVIVGLLLVVVAAVLLIADNANKSPSGGTPMPSSTNPNDPAVKGLSIN